MSDPMPPSRPNPNPRSPAPPLRTHNLTLSLASLNIAISLLLHLGDCVSADSFLSHYAALARHLPPIPHPPGLWSKRRNLAAVEVAIQRAVELARYGDMNDGMEMVWGEEAKRLEEDAEAWMVRMRAWLAGVEGSGSGSEDGMSGGSSGSGF